MPASRWRRARGVGLTALVAAGLAAAGCRGGGEEEPSSAALRPVGAHHRICAPSDAQDAFTEGMDLFANQGPAPVRIDRVDWPTTGDVEVDSIRVLRREEQDGFGAIGLWGGLPQDGLEGRFRRAWDRAVPAEGARLPLAPGDERYLVFVVGLRGTRGSGGPLTVHYTDAERRSGQATSSVRLRIAPTCSD